MNILDLLFEDGEVFSEPYQIRKYLEKQGKSQKIINGVLKIYNQASNSLNMLNKTIDETLIDKIVDYVEKGKGFAFKNLMSKKAEKKDKNDKKENIQNNEPPKPPKKRGRKPSFKSNLTFSNQGKRGRPSKQSFVGATAEEKKVSNVEEYKNFIAEWPNAKIASFSLFPENAVVLVYTVNNRGPYFVYTNRAKNDFYVFSSSKRDGDIMRPIKYLKNDLNNEKNIKDFLRDIDREKLKDFSYDDFVNAYYKTNKVRDWFAIFNDVYKKYKFKGLAQIPISEDEFNRIKYLLVPMSGNQLTNAINKFNKTKRMTLREYIENKNLL